MIAEIEELALGAFQRAAERVPAYRILLKEAGVEPSDIRGVEDFARLPVVDKANSFRRFGIEQLCVDGELGRLGSVLTSSGHSGVFAFGLSEAQALPEATKGIDDLLDYVFGVRSKPTLLINCLPMGVKVPTAECTLAETSVRPDMAIGLVQAFGKHFAQIVLVGETAFIKHVLELGSQSGVEWRDHLVHVIVGEEPLAENGRKYVEGLLGIDQRQPETGLMFSSMGVGEVGLNLFCEIPPIGPLIWLRRLLHENQSLRHSILGPSGIVPSIFTYNPYRILVEFDSSGRLLLTTLDPRARLPLIRYSTGDSGAFLNLPSGARAEIEGAGIPWDVLESTPKVMIHGRGKHALAGDAPVYPEQVKEGVYFDPALVPLTTANFRLVSGRDRVRIRIQLSRGCPFTPQLNQRFRDAISRYVDAPFEVSCESYEAFSSGMALDYERKFDYLGP